MKKKITTKPLMAALVAILATSLVSIPAANADENPFDMIKLSSGYMVADSNDGTDAERPGTGIVPVPSRGRGEISAGDVGGEAVEGTDVEKPGTGIVPGSGEISSDDVGGEAVEGTDAEKPGT